MYQLERERKDRESKDVQQGHTNPLHVVSECERGLHTFPVNLGVFSSGLQVRSLLSYAPSQQP